MFYGQAQASPQDALRLTQLLGLSPESPVASQMMGFPDRGRAGPMPPVEPLIYRLYEIVQNYGYAFKAVLNEKFGDGIMSAICFNSKVEKEVDEGGAEWVVITLRGKWWVLFLSVAVSVSVFPFLSAFSSLGWLCWVPGCGAGGCGCCGVLLRGDG